MRRRSSIPAYGDRPADGAVGYNRPDSELDEIEEQLRAMWRARGYGSPVKKNEPTPATSSSSSLVSTRHSQPSINETPGSRFQPPLTTSQLAARLMMSIDAELASPPREVPPRRLMPPSVLVVDILQDEEEEYMQDTNYHDGGNPQDDGYSSKIDDDNVKVGKREVYSSMPTEPDYSILASPTSSPIAPSLSPPNPRMDSPPTPMPSHRHSYSVDDEPSSTSYATATSSPLRVVSATIMGGMRHNNYQFGGAIWGANIPASALVPPPTTWDKSSGIVIEEEGDNINTLSPPPRVSKVVYDDVVVSPSTARSYSASQGATQSSSLVRGRSSSEAAGRQDGYTPTSLLPQAMPPPSRSHPTPIPPTYSQPLLHHHCKPTPIPVASFPAAAMYR